MSFEAKVEHEFFKNEDRILTRKAAEVNGIWGKNRLYLNSFNRFSEIL